MNEEIQQGLAVLAVLSDPETWARILRACIYLLVGFLLSRLARFGLEQALRQLEKGQRVMLARFASTAIMVLFVISALRQFGFDFTVVLGAAGIVTVAIGFASQTSASNLIAGLFLILERAIQPGDVITVGGRTGEVLSVDLLSTKLRTFDNLLVRLPNETMVKAEILSLNRFPIRRFDLPIGVSYATDLGKLQQTLFETAHRNPLCLDEPAPQLIARGLGPSSVDYTLMVWAKTENLGALQNTITREVKEALQAAGIQAPANQTTLVAGDGPIGVQLLGAPSEKGRGEQA